MGRTSSMEEMCGVYECGLQDRARGEMQSGSFRSVKKGRTASFHMVITKRVKSWHLHSRIKIRRMGIAPKWILSF